MIRRGAVFWVNPGAPRGSRPANRRPVLIVQSDAYTASALATVVAVVITSNTSLGSMPGNVFLPASAGGLPRDSVVNVTALVTLNKDDLSEHAADVPDYLLAEVNHGLRRVLGV